MRVDPFRACAILAVFMAAGFFPGATAPASAALDDDGPRPFNEAADAMADVDAALARAGARGTRALLVLGGDWCHDSRGLAAKFETPELAALIGENYELVFVDVGHRDRNLDVARRFGVGDLLGTPTVLIVSAEGALLNADSVHGWRDAASKSLEETTAYFRAYAR
ncbi:MAG: thioredoxin family protein [Pseudomonadota bacterium]|nr:thioredoxin family protein [Pseudomonadota bacterium]